MLSEVDLRLVDALQVNPRASWNALAKTMGTSATSVSRRWRTLTESGLAWTGSTMGPALFRGLFLQVECAPAAAITWAEALCALPEVVTVGALTGRSCLYAIVVAPTPAALARFTLDRLRMVDNAQISSDPFSRVFGGPTWRLGVLDRDEARDIRQARTETALSIVDSDLERRLFLALSSDARRTVTELAAELQTTPEAVRRRLAHMQAGRRLALRADLARPSAGWPYAAVVRMSVPEDHLLRTGRDIGAWAETRFCAATTGVANLTVVVNLRDLDSMGAVAERIALRHPTVTVTERSIAPRLLKVNGRLLDDSGRSRGIIPVDPWSLETRQPR